MRITHHLNEKEQRIRLSDEERQEFNMAVTRAGQRLVLTCVGDPPETLVKSLLAKGEMPAG